MHMALETKHWTRRDLERLPDDGNTYEVVRGELFVTPAPGSPHQQIVAELGDRLAPYVAEHGLGQLHFPRSVIVVGDSEVEPDLMVRQKITPPPRTWDEALLPFLVIEVLSDTTRRRDQVAKRSLYMDAGVAEYWIVDGDRRAITVVRRDRPDVVTSDRLSWHPADAAAALELDVAAIFHAALGT